VELGIKEGVFTKMPASIACNLLIGSLIGGVHTMLGKPASSSGYENKVLYPVLMGLGIKPKTADDLLKLPMPSLPKLPSTGLLGKVAAMNE
jgi:hypothetical protein